MTYVGLTGGIGSGKSTVASFFADLGVPVYNSDERAKLLMNTSESLKRNIKKLLGTNAYKSETLDKTYVAEQVFGDNALLQKLNKLVHPAVKKDFYEWAQEQTSPYVIQEAAILFENGSYVNYNKMILVKAPEMERIRRVAARDKTTTDQILDRMKTQWEDDRKIPLADYVIENINLEETQNSVKKIHEDLLKSIS
ncbi:dephospho-CoA kinase [Eudoraea chungangensis]|uniref:dephospho-CoA kinase n=1 Tax=Eudoraea chungangensis TaxID=1481905 RepID=UPI0023ECD3C8|nr:dephospho-CoA kinase [Eudoraea chungangensis]